MKKLISLIVVVSCLIFSNAFGGNLDDDWHTSKNIVASKYNLQLAQKGPYTFDSSGISSSFVEMSEYKFDQENVNTFCREKWTKRGELDISMFKYCAKGEKEGHARVISTLKKFENNSWMDTLFPVIWNKWTKRGITQYSMVAHSLEGECDSFLNYKYEKTQSNFNESKMSRCERKWRTNDSRWSLTVYCYKET